MQEASFNGFFKTLIYIIGFYYLVKILARFFLPILMKNMVNKAQENFNKAQNNSSSNYGASSNTSSKKENPKPTKQVGEYIDYEEVE
jgi:hypothetical protein